MGTPRRCANSPGHGHHLQGGDDVAERICSIEGCDRKHYGRDLCHLHYQRLRKTGRLEPLPRLSPEQRFWRCVDKNGPTPVARPELGPCWLWTAGTDGIYGTFHWGRPSEKAHRIAYWLAGGHIPKGMHVDHLCEVTRCVNPGHLEVVTPAENTRRGKAGRRQRAKTHCPQGHAYSEHGYSIPSRPTARYCRLCNNERSRRRRLRAELDALIERLDERGLRQLIELCRAEGLV